MNVFSNFEKSQKAQSNSSKAAEIKMVAGKKLCCSSNFFSKLEIPASAIGEAKVDILLHSAEPKFIIYRNDESGDYFVKGNASNMEVYCAGVCADILQRMSLVLNGSGTIRFSKYEFGEEDGSKYVIVDLSKVSYQPGAVSKVQNIDAVNKED